MSNNLTTKILNRAAKMVARGWCQHDGAISRNGRRIPIRWGHWDEKPYKVCFTEAIYRAVYLETGEKSDDHEITPTLRVIRDRLLAIKPELRESGGPGWNNAPERTQAEVVALLRAAATSPIVGDSGLDAAPAAPLEAKRSQGSSGGPTDGGAA